MASLKLMCAIAFRTALETVIFPEFSDKNDIQLMVDWNPTKLLADSVIAGERADLLLVTDEAINELGKAGIVDRESAVPLADAILALAVRPGAKKPDIATAESFRSALLAANSIAFSRSGASGLYFSKLIDTLGLGAQIRERATIVPSGFTAERLLTGEADLAVQQLSELMAVPGVEIAGRFPDDYQQSTPFSIARFSGRESQSADLLIAELARPRSMEIYRSVGLIPKQPSDHHQRGHAS